MSATGVFFHAHPDDEAHASQIPAESFLMSLPHEAFERAFGTEWFIRRDPPADNRQGTDLFATLEAPAGDTRRA